MLYKVGQWVLTSGRFEMGKSYHQTNKFSDLNLPNLSIYPIIGIGQENYVLLQKETTKEGWVVESHHLAKFGIDVRFLGQVAFFAMEHSVSLAMKMRCKQCYEI